MVAIKLKVMLWFRDCSGSSHLANIGDNNIIILGNIIFKDNIISPMANYIESESSNSSWIQTWPFVE